MLKIKDNVDLKELEKYGFVLEYDLLYTKEFNVPYDMFDEDIDEKHSINIYTKDRHIALDIINNCDTYHCYGDELGFIEDCLYELIKDGLVEKVEE